MSARPRFFLAAALLLAALLAPAAAQADFGFAPGKTSFTLLNRDGTIDTQAGSHPYAAAVHFELKTGADGRTEGGELHDVITDLPPGFFGNPNQQVMPRCSHQKFEGYAQAACPPETQVGTLRVFLTAGGEAFGPLYNLTPPPGVAAQFGFTVAEYTSLLSFSVNSEEGYGVRVSAPDTPLEVSSVTATVWGSPADPAHDPERGYYGNEHSSAQLLPFLTLPASCEGPPRLGVKVDSKQNPGVFLQDSAETLDDAGQPVAMSGCEGVPFSPKIAAQPTTKLASNPSGLDFELKLPNEGLLSPGGIAETEPRKAVVTLPEGTTVNPSFAEGAAVCTSAQYEAEALVTPAGKGCPDASKLGSIHILSPLLEEPLEGSLYLAAPYDNEFDSLTALYMVGRAPERGIFVKQAGRIDLDPKTGQITTTFDHLPPVPFSSFKLHFREGARAPLATPKACGEYETIAKLTPFSAAGDSGAVTATSSFQIERGADGGACPTGGLPPFKPGLLAGGLGAGAGKFSPFFFSLSRTDTEQEFTHFSIKLPPGVVAKLAGVPFCSEAQIAAAAARTGPNGGQEEINSPSCPAASEIGHSLAGAGVGSALAYAPGKIYLAGPYHGAPISIVAITAAKVGPFDLGTVIVRQALRVNPETGEVFIDATGSDPIPHIIRGVPTHLRDVRAYVDRPDFTLNPTDCALTSTASTVLGSGLDFASSADDNPVVVSSPFQVVNCAKLPFAPKLTLRLKGTHKRAGNPAFSAHLAMNGIGESGLAYAQVALPKTLFLDNAHLKNICTRVQFKEGAVEGERCPPGSVIGHAKAVTPILSEPLEGPIYLRANGGERQLPDIAASLHASEIHVTAVGYTDSAPGGGLRNTFEVIPDAPISSVDIDLFGGSRGLIESSRQLCSYKPKAAVKFRGHNGKAQSSKVAVKASGCGKSTKRRGKRR